MERNPDVFVFASALKIRLECLELRQDCMSSLEHTGTLTHRDQYFVVSGFDPGVIKISQSGYVQHSEAGDWL